MKLTKVLGLLFLSLFANFTTAQSAFSDQLTWGTSFELKNLEGYPWSINHTSNATYLITSNRPGPGRGDVLSIYNSTSLGLRAQHDLTFMLGDDELWREQQFVFADKLYFIASRKDRKTNIKNYYLQGIDEFGDIDSPRLVASANFGGVKNIYSATGSSAIFARDKSFKVVKSEDGKSLALLFPDDFDGHEQDSNHWNVVIYNDQLTLVEESSFLINESNIQLDKVLLSNDRKLYALGLENFRTLNSDVYLHAPFMSDATYPIGSNYILYFFNLSSKEVSSTRLSLKEGEILNTGLKLMDDQIVFYGFLGAKKNMTVGSALAGKSKQNEVYIEGFFMKTLNKDGEVIVSHVEKFKDESYKFHENQKPIVKKRDLLEMKTNFLLGDIFKNENGDFLFIAEQYRFNFKNTGTSGVNQFGAVNNSPPGMTNGYSISHRFGNILVVSCSKEGSLNWTKHYAKSEYYGIEGSFLSSYFAQMKGNNLHLLTNDYMYRTNETEYDNGKKEDRKAALSKRIVSEIILDENGKSERNLLLDLSEKKPGESEIEASLIGKMISPTSFYVAEDGNLLCFSRFFIQRGVGVNFRNAGFVRMGRMNLED